MLKFIKSRGHISDQRSILYLSCPSQNEHIRQSLGISYRLMFLIITAQRQVWFTQVHICIPCTCTWITWWSISPNGSTIHFKRKWSIGACKNPHQDTPLAVHFWKSEWKSNAHSSKTRFVLCPLKPQCWGMVVLVPDISAAPWPGRGTW